MEVLTHIWNKDPTFYVGFIAFIVACLSLLSNAKANKVKNAIDFESTYKHDAVIKDVSERVLHFFQSHAGLDIKSTLFDISIRADRKKNDSGEPSNYSCINDFLNEWERCANGIFYGIYDEKFLYGTYAGTVIKPIDTLLPFILMRQDEKAKRSRVYIKIVWLALRWRIKRDREQGENKKIPPEIKSAYQALSHHHKAVYGNWLSRFYYGGINGFDSSALLRKAREDLITYVIEY